MIGACLQSVLLVSIRDLPLSQRIIRLSRCFLLFTIAFIVLLPLGGYRDYRPYIIRRDSIQPVLIGIMILYGLGALHVLQNLPPKGRRAFAILPLLIAVYFTWMDDPGKGNNLDERDALHRIALAPATIVKTTPPST